MNVWGHRILVAVTERLCVCFFRVRLRDLHVKSFLINLGLSWHLPLASWLLRVYHCKPLRTRCWHLLSSKGKGTQLRETDSIYAVYLGTAFGPTKKGRTDPYLDWILQAAPGFQNLCLEKSTSNSLWLAHIEHMFGQLKVICLSRLRVDLAL